MLAVILTVIFLILLLVLPTALSRHAILQVISIFRKHQALSIDGAKTIDALGLRPPDLSRRLLSFRDYKPQALERLIKAEIVQISEDGKLFLSEEKITNLGALKH
jgi:hypothetical protein